MPSLPYVGTSFPTNSVDVDDQFQRDEEFSQHTLSRLLELQSAKDSFKNAPSPSLSPMETVCR